MEIIEHVGSCFVQGRSGTGQDMHILWIMICSDLLSRKTTTMLFKIFGIQKAWEEYRDVLPKPRQVFVTQSRMLAEKVEEYYSNMSTTSAAHMRQQAHGTLTNSDEVMYRRGDLPQSFGELKDEHFPLIVTFDHVLSFISCELDY